MAMASMQESPSFRDQHSSSTGGQLAHLPERGRLGRRSSETWTSSDGDAGILSDADDIDQREDFIQEYNRLAHKNGIRLMVPSDFLQKELTSRSQKHDDRSWLARKVHRPDPMTESPSSRKSKKTPRRKRSVSDLGSQLRHSREDCLKDEGLESLVRLCGKSLLYLPSDYSPGPLVLPTCLRAMAQYLLQHATRTRGVFRIPGSMRVVNALYEYYTPEPHSRHITSTVRCPNLPQHINAGVHDVASAFKRLLAGIPGGILGSLVLFDALVAISSQLYGEIEANRTKQSKLRARLIALAIGTIQSQLRRELVCAVFGLLSLVGRIAEITPREDEHGRPLPTADLMGYNALGIVFGPLLIGDLIDAYSMKLADPSVGLVLFPLTPPKSKKRRCKSRRVETPGFHQLVADKIFVTNSITEMLIAHWREVVKHMKSMGVLRASTHQRVGGTRFGAQQFPNASASEALLSQRSFNRDNNVRPKSRASQRVITPRADHGIPTSNSFVVGSTSSDVFAVPQHKAEVRQNRTLTRLPTHSDTLPVRKQRQDRQRSISSHRLGTKPSYTLLSPPVEQVDLENLEDEKAYSHAASAAPTMAFSSISYGAAMAEPREQLKASARSFATAIASPTRAQSRTSEVERIDLENRSSSSKKSVAHGVHMDDVDMSPLRAYDLEATRASDSSSDFLKSPLPGEDATMRTRKMQHEEEKESRHSSRRSEATSFKRVRSPIGADQAEESERDVFDKRSRAYADEDARSSDSQITQLFQGEPAMPDKSLRKKQGSLRGDLMKQRMLEAGQPGNMTDSPVITEREVVERSPSVTEGLSDFDEGKVAGVYAISSPVIGQNPERDSTSTSQKPDESTARGQAGTEAAPDRPERTGSGRSRTRTRMSSRPAQGAGQTPDSADARKPRWLREKSGNILSDRGATPFRPSPKAPRPSLEPGAADEGKGRTGPGAVRAMAAMFENATATKQLPTTPSQNASTKVRAESLTGRILSEYTVSTPPARSSTSSVAPSLHSRSSTPWRNSLKPEGNAKSRRDDLQSSSAEDMGITETWLGLPSELRSTPSPHPDGGKIEKVTLRPTVKIARPPTERKTLELDEDADRPPNLRKMLPPPEEPPVSHHLNRSRPTGSEKKQGSSGRPPMSDRLNDLQVQAVSPNPRTGNSMLHAQIRHLQKKLARRTEELAQARRQLETQENLDIGMLSERLRETQRECKMWKERAEAAEKRVAAFERFTKKIKQIRDVGVNESGDELGFARRTGNRRSGESDESDAGTEAGDVVQERIRASFKAMMDGPEDADGERAVSGAKSYKSEGCDTTVRKSSGAAAQIWMAAQEFLQDEGKADSAHGGNGGYGGDGDVCD